MLRQVLFLTFLLTLLISCSNKTKNTPSTKQENISGLKQDTSITNSYSYRNEQDYLNRKNIICDRLGLYDIEKGTDSLELRLWYIPSFWDPSIMYLLKVKDSRWTLFHYQIYLHTSTSEDHQYDDPAIEYFNNPIVDSVDMESVSPQKTDWNTYINNLQLDSLWGLQTESSIKGKTFNMLDGHRYLLEIKKIGAYKYLFYTAPDFFKSQDDNHRKFTAFINRLVNPIIYKGMRNP